MKKMIGGVATTNFAMQKLFAVQKEKHLRTEHGLDVFKTNCKLYILILMYYHFQTLIKFHCQLFLFRVKMVDQCDKPVNLGNFVFDEENHERKSWKLFGRTCNRSLLVLLCQFFVIVLMLVCAIV